MEIRENPISLDRVKIARPKLSDDNRGTRRIFNAEPRASTFDYLWDGVWQNEITSTGRVSKKSPDNSVIRVKFFVRSTKK